jgi:hypothetical protein
MFSRATLDFYRLAHETILIFAAGARQGDDKNAFDNVAMQLQRFQAGCFYSIKWSLTSCPERSNQTCAEEMIHDACELGSKYETFVDALKSAKYDQVEITVDESARQVTVYEGGDVTGTDWSLVDHQRSANLSHSHVSLTEDADQLTKAWTAGAYRRAVRWFGDLASEGRGDTVMFTLESGDHVPLFSRPTIIRLPDAPGPGNWSGA